MFRHSFPAALLFASILSVCGCDPADEASTPPTSSSSVTHDDADHQHADGDHAHGAGPHDGTLADWGGGKYHVEFTVNHDTKEATVYVLGSDEKTAVPIQATDGKLLLTINEPSFQVDLIAQPLEGESDGKASRFVGTHENLGIVQEFAGTISGEVDGTPYAGDFKEEPHDHDHK